MNRNRTDLLSAIVQASGRLLRQNPALWVGGFLVGVLATLMLSTHAPALDGADLLQAVLAIGVIGLALPLGWVGVEFTRQTLAIRRRRLAAIEERAEE